MSALPLAIAAGLSIWISLVIGEPLTVAVAAFAFLVIAMLADLFLWKWIGLHRCKSLRSRQASIFAGFVCVIILVSVSLTHWPLRFAYRLSRPSFDQIARSLQGGRKFEKPLRAGFFFIEKAEIYDLNGKVCLWTNIDPAGRTGFTQCPPDDVQFNLWSMIELDDDWQFVSED